MTTTQKDYQEQTEVWRIRIDPKKEEMTHPMHTWHYNIIGIGIHGIHFTSNPNHLIRRINVKS